MLVVLTADGLDQGAASPLPRGQLAAGRPGGTAAGVVALDVSQHAERRQGAELGGPGHGVAPPEARGALGVAAVAVRTAVVSVSAAHRLGQGAAAPLGLLLHVAAGGVLGAAGVGVAHDPGGLGGAGPEGCRPGQGRGLLDPGEAEAVGLVTRLLSNVALVALGAAVLVVITAHGLRQRAAGPAPGALPAAGGAARAHGLPVALLVVARHPHGGHLLHPAPGELRARRVITGLGRQVAHHAVGAAVGVVLTANSLLQGAAGPVSRECLAARLLPGTRQQLVALHIVGLQGEHGRLVDPRQDGVARRVVAGGGGQVAHGAVGAAVQVVLTADRLGQRAADPVSLR